MNQVAEKILMVRPAAFGFNTETAANNFFQNKTDLTQEQLQQKAVQEFDVMVKGLRNEGIEVLVVEDTATPQKPDAIFPNNWFNTTGEGVLNIFPMFAQNRRGEKRDDILQQLANNFIIDQVYDWTEYEAEAKYLEGTGSVIIDHRNKFVYACISPRTHPAVIEKFAAANRYKAITFTAVDNEGREIYHTNVMMCIGEGFALFCPKAISDDTERIAVAQLLETTGHENIFITQDQMKSFAGNVLHLKNKKGELFIAMSETAFNALTQEQIEKLQQYGKLLPFNVSTIERVNGGSVRCMMAEIFLQPKN
jgi:hypothetical protein